MGRIRIIALLAALFALATGFAACGGGGGGGNADAEEVVQSATLRGIESGNVDLTVNVDSRGEASGTIDLAVSGAFQKEAAAELPLLDMNLDVQGVAAGEDIAFEGGLTLLSDRAYVDYEGTEYEVDPTSFGYVKSTIEQAQQAAPEEAGGTSACQEAATGIDLATLIKNPVNEGSADVEGQETTKVSGELDVAGAADTAIELSEDPACSGQLEAVGALSLGSLDRAKGELTKAIKKAHVDLYVGDDGIVRRLSAEIVVEPTGKGRVSADVDLTLSGVNEDQEISAPSGAKPLEKLFQNLGINPLELFEGGSGGIAGLLEGLLEGSPLEGSLGSGGEGSGSGGGSADGGTAGGGNSDQQQAYFECLREVQTAADLQKCASLAP